MNLPFGPQGTLATCRRRPVAPVQPLMPVERSTTPPANAMIDVVLTEPTPEPAPELPRITLDTPPDDWVETEPLVPGLAEPLVPEPAPAPAPAKGWLW